MSGGSESLPASSTSSAGKNTNSGFFAYSSNRFFTLASGIEGETEVRPAESEPVWANWVIHSVKAEAQCADASGTLSALRKTYYGAVCFSRHGTVAAWQRAGGVTMWNTANITNSEVEPTNRMWVPPWGGGEPRDHGRLLRQTTSAADETVSDRTRAEMLMDAVMF